MLGLQLPFWDQQSTINLDQDTVCTFLSFFFFFSFLYIFNYISVITAALGIDLLHIREVNRGMSTSSISGDLLIFSFFFLFSFPISFFFIYRDLT